VKKMPIIEFFCGRCEFSFEKVFALRSDFHEGEVACPECGSAEAVTRRFSSIKQAKFVLSKNRKKNLIDLGYKMSKGEVPPGLKRIS